MIDDRKPVGSIDAVSSNSNPLAGYQTAIFDDPVHIFDDPNILFGSQTTSTNIRVGADSNAPSLSGSTYTPKSDTGDNSPSISIELRR